MPPTASNGVLTIVDKTDPGTGRGYHFFVYNGNQLGVQLADPSPTNYLSPPLLPLRDGRWHLVAVTVRRRVPTFPFNTARISFYNNKLESTATPSAKFGSLATNTPLRIGTRYINSFSGFFQGDIDELEIFNRELSEPEVTDIFMAGSIGKCK